MPLRVPWIARRLTCCSGASQDGADSLWFGSIKQYGEDHPEEFTEALDSWQGVLSAETNKQDFFEAKSERYRTVVLVALAVVLGLGVAASLCPTRSSPWCSRCPRPWHWA